MNNPLTLANIITTSNIPHHCPPSLGVFTSVQVTMLYLQENLRQQTLAGIFGTSQPTISRAINQATASDQTDPLYHFSGIPSPGSTNGKQNRRKAQC